MKRLKLNFIGKEEDLGLKCEERKIDFNGLESSF